MHKVLVLTIMVFCLFSWSCPYPLLDSEINLTLAVSGAGTVFPAAPLAAALHTDIPINAAPAAGSRFVKWTVLEGTGVVIADANAAQTTVRLTAGKAVIQAGFEYIPYTLNVKSSDAKGVTEPQGEGTAYYGVGVSIKAVPYNGYCFREWKSTAGNVVFANPYSANTLVTLNAPAAAAIEAVFMPSIKTIDAMGGAEVGGGIGLAAAGNAVYACYHDCANGERFRFISSPDRGATWSQPKTFTEDTGVDVSDCEIALTDNGSLCIGYYFGSNPATLKYKISYDKGVTWQATQTIPGNTGCLAMKASGNRMFVCFYDSVEKVLKFCQSSEISKETAPVTWTTPTVIDAISGGDIGSHNAMAVCGNTIYVSYKDSTNTNIKCAWSKDSGQTWNIRTIDFSAYNVGDYNSIAADGSNVFVVYNDTDNGCLLLASSADGGNTWPISGIKKIDTVLAASYTTLECAAGTLYLSYPTNVNSKVEMRFNKFPYNNPSAAGIINVDPVPNPANSAFCILHKAENDVYLVYRDSANSLKFARSSTDGSRW